MLSHLWVWGAFIPFSGLFLRQDLFRIGPYILLERSAGRRVTVGTISDSLNTFNWRPGNGMDMGEGSTYWKFHMFLGTPVPVERPEKMDQGHERSIWRPGSELVQGQVGRRVCSCLLLVILVELDLTSRYYEDPTSSWPVALLATS